MAQTSKFYQIHEENGQLFKAHLIDTGLYNPHQRRGGYPIHQMKNYALLGLYIEYRINRSEYLNNKTKELFHKFIDSKKAYSREAAQYHNKSKDQ